jgi:hypothetical protein
MALVQRDFILRMIEAVSAALARALRRRAEKDYTGARQDIAEAVGQVLGPRGALAAMVDSRTAADIISEARQIALYATLLAEDARILDEMGSADAGRKVRVRALELMLETRIRDLELPDSDLDVLRALVLECEGVAVAPRYAEALASARREGQPRTGHEGEHHE